MYFWSIFLCNEELIITRVILYKTKYCPSSIFGGAEGRLIYYIKRPINDLDLNLFKKSCYNA